ncbi:MAG: TonB-dependent receptor [Desulfobacterales bacterium]|nr:TonB-dependent receptor [Desulfobacterales bacterium]
MKVSCFFKGVCTLLFLLFLAPTAIWGEEAKSGQVFDLGEVVVKERSETITQVGTVDTVDAEQIELTNSRTVSEALNTLPGVTLSTGGSKAESSINIRGFGTRYVPIFYDGVPLYVPYDGYVDGSNLTTDNVSRIDVSKGVSSVLYGFNTMGGVINMVSRKPQEKLEGSYRVEVNEDSAYNGNVHLGSNQDKFYFTLGGGLTDSNGWHLSDRFDGNANENGGMRENSDLEEWNAAAKFGLTPADGHEYALGFQIIRKEKGIPTTTDTDDRARYRRFTDWDKETYYFIGNTGVNKDLSFKTRLYLDKYYNVLDAYDDATFTTQDNRSSFHSTYDDYSYGGSLVARTTYIPKNTLSASFHYKMDVHEEQGDYDEAWGKYEQVMYSFGIEDDIKITENLAFVIGAAYDIQDPKKAFNGTTDGELRDSDSAFSPQAGILYTVLEDMDIHFSVGQKTRWPTLKELYTDGLDDDVKPNPDLSEEKSTNWELGVKKPLPYYNQAGITLFYSDVEDMIEKVDITDATYDEQYQNIDEARFRGIEFQFSSKFLPDNDLTFHYTYLDAANKSPGATSENLDNIPEHKVYLSDRYQVNKWLSLFGSIEYNSDRYDTDANDNQVKTGEFWLVDFKIMTEIYKFLNFELGVKNLLDENYEVEIGYPQSGRTFFAGINGTL